MLHNISSIRAARMFALWAARLNDSGYLVGRLVENAMPIVGCGIDLVEMSRIASMLDKHGDAFLARCFTSAERTWLSDYKFPLPHIAGRFAAKEAIVKALGTGFRDAISWLDMEILPDPLGKPVITLRGAAAEMAATLGVVHWHISLSHTDTAAIASVIAEN